MAQHVDVELIADVQDQLHELVVLVEYLVVLVATGVRVAVLGAPEATASIVVVVASTSQRSCKRQ